MAPGGDGGQGSAFPLIETGCPLAISAEHAVGEGLALGAKLAVVIAALNLPQNPAGDMRRMISPASERTKAICDGFRCRGGVFIPSAAFRHRAIWRLWRRQQREPLCRILSPPARRDCISPCLHPFLPISRGGAGAV